MTEDLPERVKFLLNAEDKHDCFFMVGPHNGQTEKIGAIKILLMADSEPFRVMLGNGELAETGDIRVKDVEPETFKCFINCVYGGSSVIIPKLTFMESAKLLYVLEKYLVYHLKNELVNHMEKLFSFENIFVALSHPICQEIASIKEKMLKILKYDFSKIVYDAEYLELGDSAISWMLRQNCIQTKEVEIWDAVLKWAKHKTNSSDGKVLRSKIVGFLKYIRFLSMDYKDFHEYVVSSKVLLKKEINDICNSFVLDKPCSIQHLCSNRSNRYNIYEVSTNINSSIIEDFDTAFIQCSINSVSDFPINKIYHSKTYSWAGHFWCISGSKKKIEEVDNLGVFLYCTGKTPNWTCKVDVEISLISFCGGLVILKNYTQTFSPSTSSWGYPNFYKWNELLNPTSGFVMVNSIVIHVRIKLHN